ncbi:hypothetical protein EJ06DRAFT_527474 [Trichodelitschia bisporula]|uniref:Mannosyltransferase n=1 Tax=Trichodelitschia bisporula TaxID=703511 RepID=A0A6G1I6X7_9PEZI|nr:hypothetical protein EJ06DRAFT_527474 [Trichodelitschia bisporula]
MNPLLDALLTLLIPSITFAHLYLSPFTKVEESFNIQAAHDILTYGIPSSNLVDHLSKHYDHFNFPGPVPRTFFGAATLAGLAKPWLGLVKSMEQQQILVRQILGLANALTILSLRGALNRCFGASAGNWYILLQASQFHVIYYASRTLPNMFAFVLTTLALRYYVLGLAEPRGSLKAPRLYGQSLFLLTFAGVVFRAELAVLVLAQSAVLFLIWRIGFRPIFTAGMAGLFLGLLATVPLDSLLWDRVPTWPELVGFYYNTVLGKSSDWGTSPWYFYFFNALPRLLLNPLTYALLVPKVFINSDTRQLASMLLAPYIAFVGLYSFLPHKEWRFIIYAVPALTGVAAAGASQIWTAWRCSPSLKNRLLATTLVASVLASFVFSTALLAISSANYPGGMAVAQLRTVISRDGHNTSGAEVLVHADNLVCQTGLTRFLERHGAGHTGGEAMLVFDKTEDEELRLRPEFWSKFDYVLAEAPERVIGKWEVVGVVKSFAGIKVLKPGMEEEGDGEDGLLKSMTEASIEAGLGRQVAEWWGNLRRSMRGSITKGWWIDIRLEPKIHILRRERTPPATAVVYAD